MIPTKVKDLIPETAKDLNISEEDLSNMLSFYFKEVKKKMSNLEYLHFVIRGLGNMTIKGWLIEKEIEDKQKSLSLSSKAENIEKLKFEIDLLEKVLPKWKEEKRLKKEHIVIKKEYYNNKLNPIQ
jgi:hypothetical protein